jgi:adenosine deaminase
MKNILLCTLGASWAVIPEAYAFATSRLYLYQNHPDYSALLALKEEAQLEEPDEIWVCTTQGEQTQNSLQQLINWIGQLAHPPYLRIWQAKYTDQLASQQECLLIRELILRACLKAHQEAEGGQVILSLAGGRKTMSADMQWAASLFGCQALLHVISADGLPAAFRNADSAAFTQSLPAEWAKLVTPLIAGKTNRSDLLDIKVDGIAPIVSEDYPLAMPTANQIAEFTDTDNALGQELTKRERDSSRLFGNFLQHISNDESHENWRSLYRLPPRHINQLRGTMLNQGHLQWLVKIPKADIHRHLGGCLDLDAQRKIGREIWGSLDDQQQNQAVQHCQNLLDSSQWDWSWPEQLKTHGHEKRSHYIAAILLHASKEQLHDNLWGVTEPRIQLKQHFRGFSAYERPGELTGSALLSNPVAIAPYAQSIVEQAVAEGLAYIELRGSPHKYGEGLEFLNAFHQALEQALTSLPKTNRPLFRFIIILDRRDQQHDLQKTIDMAIQAKQQLPDFIVGLDMAGDETRCQPDKVASLFTRAFEKCLPITIHAGEGEKADSIWKAAYHLHADRIGHGLTINDNANLAQRFRDRNICLELCPSSNREVVGFKDPAYPQTQQLPTYPLLPLWRDKGLPLTLCTDNPGISRTSLANEYLVAARMTGNKLSQWDALAMIKQGFVHAFLPAQQKEQLLKAVDVILYSQILESL